MWRWYLTKLKLKAVALGVIDEDEDELTRYNNFLIRQL